MKIVDLREKITGSTKVPKNPYVHNTSPGQYYIDDGIRFIQGYIVWEVTGMDSRFHIRYQNFGSFLKAVDDGEIKSGISDEFRKFLSENEEVTMTATSMLYLFPDDFEMPFRFCHRLIWYTDPGYSTEADNCLYYFHSTGRDDLTRDAHERVPLHNTKSKKKPTA